MASKKATKKRKKAKPLRHVKTLSVGLKLD